MVSAQTSDEFERAFAQLKSKECGTGSLPFANTIGIVPVGDFAAIAETTLPVAKITAYLAADQIGRQSRQAIVVIIGPAIFDHKLPAFNVAGMVQTPPEAG